VADLSVGFVYPLSYANTKDRGCMEVTVTHKAVESHYVYVERVAGLDFETVEDTQTIGIELFA
jgi:hypothetical protein